jgi:hypothetical protein
MLCESCLRANNPALLYVCGDARALSSGDVHRQKERETRTVHPSDVSIALMYSLLLPVLICDVVLREETRSYGG